MLVPVGLARRFDDRRAIELDNVTGRHLAEAPRLRYRAINRGDEDATLEVYGFPGSRELPSADYYKRPEFDESLLAILTDE